ncbi:MAG: 1,4-dihydroxy-2-naphthoate polyprenyltransferase [Acidimicrobiia bacterium]|nr:1,4-dihydroxy-2-naphthoate polyprenyltransferase [Acidimicrobiia bacterium]
MTALRPWVQAARPPTLWASAAPVAVGAGLAWGDGVFRLDAFLVAMAAALLINIGANFANDASDARRGADGPARVGPLRAVASGLLGPRQVWTGVAVVFALASLGGIYLAVIAGWPVLAIGAASLAAALAYTGGPRPYGYLGLGEAAVFVFFGLAATVGSRFVHDATAPAAAWLLAVPMGFTVTAILVANNVRDVDTDREAGKRTLAVTLGREGGRLLYTALMVGAFVALTIEAAVGAVPPLCLLGLLAAPAAVPVVAAVRRETEGPALVRALRATARVHALFGVLVAVGAAI